jgi:indolepyruvate ferredoxin oxidoreductase alpha subunit
VIREEVAREAPSVIVTKRPCLLAKEATKPGQPFEVDEELCKTCRLCLRLGCPAISLTSTVASIDASVCAGCGVCVTACPFDAVSRRCME